jgi:hypothetical protein
MACVGPHVPRKRILIVAFKVIDHRTHTRWKREMKKPKSPTELRQRYTPMPAPPNSFATIKSPLSEFEHVRVMRWHDYHGLPKLFFVTDKRGRQLGDMFPYEPHALAHAEELEREKCS